MLKETIIALTLYGEAGNQDYQGKLMVASVIVQRAKDKRVPPEIICKSYKQFSCWNRGIVYLTKGLNRTDWNSQNWLDCVSIAYNLRKIKPQGYTHYHADYCIPKWARKALIKRAYVKHGRHLFYKKADLK